MPVPPVTVRDVMSEELPELIVADAPEWHAWLSENHAQPRGVWLVLSKKGTTSPTSLTYSQAVEEALCHGWIDGQAKPRDDSTYRQRFTPRRARSTWSQRNVGLVARLASEGRMQPAGIAEVERAKADGRWAAAYPGQAATDVPADLASALAESPRATAMFAILTAQNRFAILYRLAATRRTTTRNQRIEHYVAMLSRGETLYPQKRTLDA
jgi:uncharacterized protein YdeI (YjbR/CyaY-like superfamily)